MGCWGMGMTQSDEFCEIYDNFMKEYGKGKSVADISADILKKYHQEFSDDDGIMHDVYFALAKAEWMACEQSETVLNKVKNIIDSDANIEFYRELGASDKDLTLRRKKLVEFFEKLQVPRSKPMRRRIDPLDREKDLPSISAGECYAYKYDDSYRIAVILDRFNKQGKREMVLCCILKNKFLSQELKKIDFVEEEIGCIGGYLGEEFLSKSALKKIGEIPVPKGLNDMWFDESTDIFGWKKDFKKDFSNKPSLKLSRLLNLKRWDDEPLLKQFNVIIIKTVSTSWRQL